MLDISSLLPHIATFKGRKKMTTSINCTQQFKHFLRAETVTDQKYNTLKDPKAKPACRNTCQGYHNLKDVLIVYPHKYLYKNLHLHQNYYILEA